MVHSDVIRKAFF